MLNTDTLATTWIAFIQALDDDTRIDATDRAFLTAYATKLGSAPTNRRDDNRALQIVRKVFSYANVTVR